MSAFEFVLFVAGNSDRSRRSVAAIRALCDDRLGDDCHLTVIDVLEDPRAAEEARVMATPTLVRMSPQPRRSVVGDLSDTDRVAGVLGLPVPSRSGHGGLGAGGVA